MDIFFRGPMTSSPIKTWNTQGLQLSYSFDSSFLSDTSYECFSTGPETDLVLVSRRSPRLLANGYYVLTEDSVITDDHGNLTLSPTKTNISYKENLARIFRRRRKARRSFGTLLNDVSQSLLSGSIFVRDGTLSSTELSSCLDVSSSNEEETSVCFTYDRTNNFPKVECLSEDCSGPVLPAEPLNSLTDVPQSKCHCTPTNPPSDAMFRKAFLAFLFTLCLCATMFSRCVFGGLAVAVAFLFLISSICGPMSAIACTNWTKTREIASRNE